MIGAFISLGDEAQEHSDSEASAEEMACSCLAALWVLVNVLRFLVSSSFHLRLSRAVHGFFHFQKISVMPSGLMRYLDF